MYEETRLHHITAITGPPQRTIDFFVGALGLRLVKKTVNFDDPGTYHLYFGVGKGAPGSIFTVFPWASGMKGRTGGGMVSETLFEVPHAALPFWRERLDARGHAYAEVTRLGHDAIGVEDPDGLRLALVASGQEAAEGGQGLPPDVAVRRFAGASLAVLDVEGPARLLVEVFGYEPAGAGGDGASLQLRAPETRGDVLELQLAERKGRIGVGTVHHIAFRARDAAHQQVLREKVQALGVNVTPVMDRRYFHSVYFRDPERTGGVLFEIATDAPGFTADEAAPALGTALMLPPWLEPQRADIEARLPTLAMPG